MKTLQTIILAIKDPSSKRQEFLRLKMEFKIPNQAWWEASSI